MAIDPSSGKATLSCDSVVMAQNYSLKVRVGKIFNATLGWNITADTFDCFGKDKKACENTIDGKFLKLTNNFDLKVRNTNNVTLAQAFCNEFPQVEQTKLRLGQFYSCHNFGGSGVTGHSFEHTYSTQLLECVNGVAVVREHTN